MRRRSRRRRRRRRRGFFNFGVAARGAKKA
jgi:hypothetical protein